MVLPTVGAAATDFTPSMSAKKLNVPGSVSFQLSTAGVAASLPRPEIGQTAVVSIGMGGVPRSSSAFTRPEEILGVQLVLPQFGGLSLRTPKLDPPTISR